jgi:hypothetical protein
MPAAPLAAEAWFLVVVLGVALLGLLVAWARSKRRHDVEDDQHVGQFRRLKQSPISKPG